MPLWPPAPAVRRRSARRARPAAPTMSPSSFPATAPAAATARRAATPTASTARRSCSRRKAGRRSATGGPRSCRRDSPAPAPERAKLPRPALVAAIVDQPLVGQAREQRADLALLVGEDGPRLRVAGAGLDV